MSRKLKTLSLITTLFYLLAPSTLCLNNRSIVVQKSIKVTRFLQNLDTDASGFFSRIPFRRFHRLRALVVQPLIGIIGNAVESVSNTKRSLGKLDKVQFLLYADKRNNESYWNLVPEDDFSIMSAKFTEARPIKILIHGFQAAGSYEFPQKTKNAYLQFTNFNVIVVDWGPLSYPPINYIRWIVTYPSAVNNLRFVSRRVADLIVSLARNGIIKSPDDVHVVGFSLGAHIAGQVGFIIENRLGSKLGRITALEPASPLLETAAMQMRVDKTDAKFVDVIHTSHLALYYPLGHADFYPNGGRNQNECYDGLNAWQNPIQALNDVGTLCSHEYAYELFTWSIENRQLIGCSCSSWSNFKKYCKAECHITAKFGEFCSSSVRGVFFLETRLPDGFNINPFPQ